MRVLVSVHESVQEDAQLEAMQTIIYRVTDAVAKTYGLGEEEELSVLLCDNATIHALNLEYRGIDRPTDVLSFALNEDATEPEEEEEVFDGDDEIDVEEEGLFDEVSAEEEHLLGDLIISVERMREQAEEYGHGEERELAYLTVHGCLHILGYDHMTDEDKAEMRTEEEFILKDLGYIREGQAYHE